MYYRFLIQQNRSNQKLSFPSLRLKCALSAPSSVKYTPKAFVRTATTKVAASVPPQNVPMPVFCHIIQRDSAGIATLWTTTH